MREVQSAPNRPLQQTRPVSGHYDSSRQVVLLARPPLNFTVGPEVPTHMVNLQAHRALLDRVLRDYALEPGCLEIVPDVQAWCHSNNVEEENPWRSAKCFYSEDGCHIVMCEVLTDSMIASGKNAMESKGFATEVATLDTDVKYLVHLMLHEIGCFTLQTSEQEARDAWAFREMARYVA